MTIILQKMIHEILPPSKRPPSPNYVPANVLPSTVMVKTMKNVFTKGWVDIRSLYTLEYLVNLCGTDWFTDRLVKVKEIPVEATLAGSWEINIVSLKQSYN